MLVMETNTKESKLKLTAQLLLPKGKSRMGSRCHFFFLIVLSISVNVTALKLRYSVAVSKDHLAELCRHLNMTCFQFFFQNKRSQQQFNIKCRIRLG